MQPKPSPWLISLAFAALYIIWGSTYLGIKVAIETIPPFLMATGRFVCAGLILYAAARLKGAARPSRAQWKHSLIVGALLIAGGNGAVSYAESHIDSSMAALIIASNPLFMILFAWLGGVQSRPKLMDWVSVFGGMAGVAVLIGTGDGIDIGDTLWGYLIVLLAVLLWSLGSVYSKRNPQAINPWLHSGMQMICGGGVCLVAGLFTDEFSGFAMGDVSLRSWMAFLYLLFAGSLIGFTSYVFLLKYCNPSTVSSHAYVNPVVAVFLGWLILGESLNLGGWVGSGMILVSVFVLLRRKS